MKGINLKRTITSIVTVFLFTGVLVILRPFPGGTAGMGYTALASAEENGVRRKCTLQTPKGTYGFGLVGSFTAVGPVATSGTTTFDGDGHDFGEFALNTFGGTQHFSFSGVYTVKSDCTGTATLNISPSVLTYSQLHFEAVGTNNETEIKWLITDAGIVLAGTLTKQ